MQHAGNQNLKLSDDIERKLYKLYYYAHLSLDVDTTNTVSQELSIVSTLTVCYFMNFYRESDVIALWDTMSQSYILYVALIFFSKTFILYFILNKFQ